MSTIIKNARKNLKEIRNNLKEVGGNWFFYDLRNNDLKAIVVANNEDSLKEKMEANKRLMEATRKLNDFQKKLLSPPREQSVTSEDNDSVFPPSAILSNQSKTQKINFNAPPAELKSITSTQNVSMNSSVEQP